MSLRQVCNVAYAAITQWMSAKDIEKFDRELHADDAAQVSHGTESLMKIMGIRPPAPPAEQFQPVRPEPSKTPVPPTLRVGAA